MSKLRTAARLLKVTALAVRLKEQRQFPLYVKSATAIIHKKQAAAFERSFTKAIVPLFKNQVKSILAKLRALPESAVSSAKSSELLQKIYNSEEWDAELVNRALPPIAVAMSESALATFNQFIQDVERRKSWGMKCGGPGSGVPGPCPTGILRGTGTREDPIHCGENLKLAVKLLAEGHHIRLAQHEHVSTLVNKMHKTIQKAVKSGQVPPHFDLCKVTAPNSNLFCTEHKGYPRAKMPQMRGIPVPGSIAATLPVNKAGKVDVSAQFIKSLRNQGIKVTEKNIRASFLRASQAEIVGARVVELVKAAEAGTKDLRERPIFVSKDNYVLDGHHHWAAIVGVGAARGKDIKIPVYMVDVEIGESIDLANEFARSIGIAPKSGAAPAGKWYNGTGENDDGIGREKQAGTGIDQATQGPEGKSGISDQGGLFGWDRFESGRGGAVAGWDRQAEDVKVFCATGPGGGVDPSCGAGGRKPKQTETPEFKAWFGKSQVVNADGTPKVMYSGSGSKEDFVEFKPNWLGLIFLTDNTTQAGLFAGKWGDERFGNKIRVYPAYVKAENIYDGMNKEHIQRVLNTFTQEQHAASKVYWDDFFDKHPDGGVVSVRDAPPRLEGLLTGGWQTIEHPQVIAAIRSLGFDGILTGEIDSTGEYFRGVGVFSSTQIKSATGNSGAFDPNNPDITKAFCATGPGGGVDPTCSPGQSGKSGHKVRFESLIQLSETNESGFEYSSHDQIANSPIGKALGLKAEKLEDQIGALTGAVPDMWMSVVVSTSGKSIEIVSDEDGLYEMKRTLVLNSKGTVTAHNDLFRIHKDKGSVPPGQGVKMFRDQVNALAEAGVTEIRTNAAGSKADGADWNGYYTWPLVGYDKALTTHDLKYVPDHPQYTGMDRISDVFSTREGAAWWKENGQSLDDLVFDLSEGSYSRQRLEWYEADRAERGQPIPKAFDAKNCGTGSGGFKPGNTCARGGSQFMEYVTPEEFIAARNNSTRNAFLSHITPDDLRSHTLIMTKDGKAGAAVSPEGDIQNVFNNGGPKGIGQEVMIEAVNQGGVTLDCYAGFLPGYYSNLGFTETGRMKFNREFAPSDWDYAKDGEPDVVFMARTKEESSNGIRERFEQWVGARKPQPPRTADYYRGEDWDTAKSDSRGVAISTVVGAKSRSGDGTGGNPAGTGRVQSGDRGDGFGRGSLGGESEHPGLFRFVQAELKTFCATGPGGGVDPTCSPGQSGAKGKHWSESATVPAKPGTVPIPHDHIRLYHYSSLLHRNSKEDNRPVDDIKFERAESLRTGGIRMGAAKGDVYHEPNAIWGGTEKPDDGHVIVEFHVHRDDPRITRMANFPTPSDNLEEWSKRNQHVTFGDDIKPKDIIAVHETRHKHYRYLTERPSMIQSTLEGEFDHLMDDDGYGPAVRKVKAEHGTTDPVPPESHKLAAKKLSKEAKKLHKQSHTWDKKKPWNATLEAVQNGKVAGFAFGSYGNRGQETAHYEDGKIVLSPKFFELNHEESRKAVVWHELGHSLSDSMLADGTAFRLVDAGHMPGGKNAKQSDLDGHTTPGEVLAQAYSILKTEPEFLQKNFPGLVDPVRQRALALGMPVDFVPDVKSYYGTGIKASTAMEWLDSLDDEDVDLEDVEYSTPYGNVSMGMATEYPDWMKKIITTRLQETFAEPYWADINRTTGGDIEGLLQRGLEEGWSIADMAREIEDRYGATDYPESRGRLIARTESGNALNGARSDTIDALIDDLGMRDKIRKVWLSVLGNTTRDDHAREDGVPADDDGYWMLGGERCRWPGDVRLSAKQRCNCQCTIVTQFGMNPDDAQGLIDEHRALQATATRQRKKVFDAEKCGGPGGKPGPCPSGGRLSETQVLDLIKQSPNLASITDWDSYADRFGVRGDFTKGNVSVSRLQKNVEAGYLRLSKIDAAVVADKVRTGKLNEVVITKEPGRGMLVIDGTHSLLAAIKRGDSRIDAIVSDSVADSILEKSTGCGTGSGGFKPGNTCARGGGFQQVTVPKTNKAALELIVDGVMSSIESWKRDPVSAEFLKDNPPPGRDVIEANYGKLIRSRKTFAKKPGVNEVNSRLVDQVDAGLRENVNNERFQRFTAAVGPQRVVVRHQLLEDAGAAEYRAGVTHVYDYADNEFDLKARDKGKATSLSEYRDQQASRSKPFHMAEAGGMATILRHEYGHQLMDYLGRDKQRQIQQLFFKLSDVEKEAISPYANRNYDELFAETFALITHPEYKAADYPKWVGDFEITVGKWADDYAKID